MDWVTAVASSGKLVIGEVEGDGGEAAFIAMAEGPGGQFLGMEAAIYEGDEHLWLRTGWTLRTEEGGQGGERPTGADLDLRVQAITLNRSPAGVETTAGAAERRATFGNCLEHRHLGLPMALGAGYGQKCEECGLFFCTEEQYQEMLKGLNLRGVTNDELPY